jgi:hypothetical protein
MTIFTRQQLYDLVWNKPTVQIAAEIGVSDVAVAKACKRHQIPKPPVGYWAMLQHGKEVLRTELPKVDDPGLETISFEPVPPEQRLANQTKESATETEALTVLVPDILNSPHPLVQRTMRSLQAAKPESTGLCSARAKDCLDVIVSKTSIDRAMRIMDAFVKALVARGAKVWVDVPEYGRDATYAEFDGEKWSCGSMSRRRSDRRSSRRRRSARTPSTRITNPTKKTSYIRRAF